MARSKRNKLIELSGYNINREKIKISKIYNDINISKNIFRRKIYLRISNKSDIVVNLIYKKPYKYKSKVFIFLAGSTSGAHIGWGEAKVQLIIREYILELILLYKQQKKVI